MFENIIKQIVKVTLNKKADIQFFNGTLFVSGITIEEANNLHKVIYASYSKAYNADVIMSGNNDYEEFAFDFC